MLFLQCKFFLIVFILIHSITCSTNDIQSTTSRSRAEEIAVTIEKIEKELEKDENHLKSDREELEQEKQISKSIDHTDVLQLNVGGEIIITTRQTLTKIHKSILSLLFYGRWEHKLQRDQEGNIFLDFNPIVFRHLLDQLQIIETNNLIDLYPPVQPSLVEPFKKMVRKLGLHQFLSSEKQNVIIFNVGGQMITNRHTTFTEVSNSTFDTIVSPSKIMNFNNQSNVFLDYNPKLFQHLINQLRKESFKSISSWELSLNEERISFKRMLIDLSILVVPTTTNTSTSTTTSTIASTTTTTITNNTKPTIIGVTTSKSNQDGTAPSIIVYDWGLNTSNRSVVYGGRTWSTQYRESYSTTYFSIGTLPVDAPRIVGGRIQSSNRDATVPYITLHCWGKQEGEERLVSDGFLWTSQYGRSFQKTTFFLASGEQAKDAPNIVGGRNQISKIDSTQPWLTRSEWGEKSAHEVFISSGYNWSPEFKDGYYRVSLYFDGAVISNLCL